MFDVFEYFFVCYIRQRVVKRNKVGVEVQFVQVSGICIEDVYFMIRVEFQKVLEYVYICWVVFYDEYFKRGIYG